MPAFALATVLVAATPLAARAADGHGTGSQDIPVQLLAMNDFHGRISETTGNDSILLTDPGADGTYGTADDTKTTVGGAADVAGTVEAGRADFVADGGRTDDSFFVAAGDLVSASPFNSSVFKDEPTIEVLDAMGLDVSSVGNHEFDRGTQELRRISAATDGRYTDDVTACEGIDPGITGCFGEGEHAFTGADFPYLAANVISKSTGKPMLPPYQVFDVGHGKKLGLIGIVTDTTPTIVSPTGITDVDFIDEATAINQWVPVLQRRGIQAIGVLIHEGGQNVGTDALDRNGCDTLSGPIVDINAHTDPAVDFIVSAHSHQAYDCLLTDPAGQPRLVTQAGYYGRLVSDIRLTVDGRTGDIQRFCAPYTANNLPVTRDKPDPDIAAIVGYWDARAAEAGNEVVGTASADILRGGTQGSARDVESPLGNLVAQAQLEAAGRDPGQQNPVVAFMNPGGLRADIAAGPVSYADLFAVQPFGNTVNSITLTGEQIRAVLEQQFQVGGPRGTNLVLGTSEGFSYQYDTARPYGDRINAASITLNGTPIDPAANYRVVANSFLIAGGDTFTAFTGGTGPATGPVDVDTAVAYFQAHGTVGPPAANHGTAVPGSTWSPNPATGLAGGGTTTPPPATVDGTSGVAGPGPGPGCDATATVDDSTPAQGQAVTVTGTKFASGEKVTVTAGDRTLGRDRADGQGTATIRFTVPRKATPGAYQLVLTGTSDETARIPVTVEKAQ